MFAFLVTLILTNYAVTVYAQEIKILKNGTSPRIVDEELAKNVPALPFVLFENETEVEPPEDIEYAVVKGKRIVEGTKFLSGKSEKQIFFCPKLHDPNMCLVPLEFGEHDILECPSDPTEVFLPLPKEDTNKRCGHTGGGTPITLYYNVCPVGGLYKYEKFQLVMYEFCYDKDEKQNLYTSHFINSSKLLQSTLLLREKQVLYSSVKLPEYCTQNDEMIQDLLNDKNGKLSLDLDYQIQKLVPPGDMAFAEWRKTTHFFVNFELQQIDLFPIWNEMNENVRKTAVQMHDQCKFYIRTGVFHIPSINNYDPEEIETLQREKQKYTMWVKLIDCQPKNNWPKRMVAILMNNFISVENPTSLVRRIQDEIKQYCPISICSTQFQQEVQEVGGVVQCCRINEKILELFGLEGDFDNLKNLPPIAIPDAV